MMVILYTGDSWPNDTHIHT